MNAKKAKRIRNHVNTVLPELPYRVYKEPSKIEYIYGYINSGKVDEDGKDIMIPKVGIKYTPIRLDRCKRLAIKELKKTMG